MARLTDEGVEEEQGGKWQTRYRWMRYAELGCGKLHAGWMDESPVRTAGR